MKNTVIIHPSDRSTDDLRLVYRDLGIVPITETYERDLFNDVANAGRTICLGHGMPQGLIGNKMKICVNASFGGVFKNQPDNIYIWCNADQYVKEHGLSAFCTGMFISETMEAHVFDIKATHEQLTYSNRLFSKLVNNAIVRDMTNEKMAEYVLRYYVDDGNEAVEYNRQRIFAFDSGYMTYSHLDSHKKEVAYDYV